MNPLDSMAVSVGHFLPDVEPYTREFYIFDVDSGLDPRTFGCPPEDPKQDIILLQPFRSARWVSPYQH